MATTPSPSRRSYAAVAAANAAPTSPTTPTRLPIVSLTYDDDVDTNTTVKRPISTPIRDCSVRSPASRHRRTVNTTIATRSSVHSPSLAATSTSTLNTDVVRAVSDSPILPASKPTEYTNKKKTIKKQIHYYH